MSKELIELKELKHCDAELKELNKDKGIVSFYIAQFNKKDQWGDTTLPTAFDKAIAGGVDNIYHYKNHNDNDIVGVPIEMKKDDKGVYVTSQLALGTIAGDDMHKLYKMGAIKNHSYGAYNFKSTPDPKGGRILHERGVFEVSSLTKPAASKDTPVISLKSFEDSSEIIAKLDYIIREGNLSPEAINKLFTEYKQLEKLIMEKQPKEKKTLVQRLLGATELKGALKSGTIGKTASGKDIGWNKPVAEYSDFDQDDHMDAANAHMEQAKSNQDAADNTSDYTSSNTYRGNSYAHTNLAVAHMKKAYGVKNY